MHTLLNVACVPALLAGLLFIRRRQRALQIAWAAVFAAFAAYKAGELIRIAMHNVARPPLWDFKVFWMVGQICASGRNVYDVASYQPFGPILNPANDIEFNTIALKIGMPYPPPAVMLFCPLGHFANLQTAMVAWYSVLFLAVALSIVVLWREFFRADGLAGLVAVAALVFALPGTAMTVGFGQLNFFALLLLLLVWRERRAWRAGIWLAPLVVLRPLCFVFALYFLVRRQWHALATLALTTGALFAVSLPFVGTSGLASYLQQNPTQRYPEIYFKGLQSLYQVFVTLANRYDGFFSLSAHPVFVVTSALLIAGAAYVCAVAGEDRRTICFSMLLALGLLLYPNSGTHYSVLLLVPLLCLWRERRRLHLSDGAIIAFFTLQYVLLIYRNGALTTALIFALDAAVFATLALRLRQRPVGMATTAPALIPA